MKNKRGQSTLHSFFSGCRHFVSAAFVVVLLDPPLSRAHDWHRPHSAGSPVQSEVFSIPAPQGDEPVDSEAVAERAEAFSSFHPHVWVRWDNQWFYIESDGIAHHDMMMGITAWQQQVAVPQYYYEDDAWTIPLQSLLALSSIAGNGSEPSRFNITGTPDISYPFSWSSDLEQWYRFGFLLLDGSGSASFELELTAPRGFLKAE